MSLLLFPPTTNSNIYASASSVLLQVQLHATFNAENNLAVARQQPQEKKSTVGLGQQGPRTKLVGVGNGLCATLHTRAPTSKLRAICQALNVDFNHAKG